MLVVMGPIMEIPVIDLFAAAILPGILLASLYAAYDNKMYVKSKLRASFT